MENSPVFKYEINSSFRPVSHRLTNDVNSTMSGKYVEIIEFSVLHIKAIKYCSHLKLIMYFVLHKEVQVIENLAVMVI